MTRSAPVIPARRYEALIAEVQRRAARESPYAIAKDLGISKQVAWQWATGRNKGPTRIYADEAREEVRLLMEEGLTNRQIASLTGVGIDTVKKWRRAFGMTGRQRREHRYPRAYSPDFKRYVLDRVASGETMRAISKDTGITHETISRWWVASGGQKEQHKTA